MYVIVKIVILYSAIKKLYILLLNVFVSLLPVYRVFLQQWIAQSNAILAGVSVDNLANYASAVVADGSKADALWSYKVK